MNLRSKLIRLAYENPEIRPDILPLLKKAYSLNVGSTSLAKARVFAEGVFQKPVEEVLPDFDRNYKRLQKAVKSAPGIPRIQMPVIEPADIKVFQKRLQEGRLDILRPFAKGKFVTMREIDKSDGEWVDLGFEDGDPKDDAIPAQVKSIAVGKLKPTQNQIWLEKTFGNIAKFGVPRSGSPVLSTTVIVSSDGYILDGHHRYSQAMMADPNLKMKALYVPMPIKTLLEVGKAYGEAIGNKPKQA